MGASVSPTRLVFAAGVACSVALVLPDTEFGEGFLRLVAFSFVAGVVAGSAWAMLLVPLCMVVADSVAVATAGGPNSDYDVIFPALVLFVGFLMIVVGLVAGVGSVLGGLFFKRGAAGRT